MKKFFISLIVMYLLFPFYFLNIRKIQIIVFYFGMTVFVICKLKILIKLILKINRGFFSYLISAFCLMAFSSFLFPIFHQTNDYAYFVYFLKVFCGRCLSGVSMFLVVNLNEKKKTSLEDFLLYIIRGISLYVAFSFLFLLPEIRAVWINITAIEKSERGVIGIDSYYTRFGLQGFSGFYHTFLCSLGLLFLWYTIIQRVKHKHRINNLFKYMFFLFSGSLFYGRSGLISSILIAFFAFLYLSVKYKKMVVFISTFTFFASVILFVFTNIDILTKRYPWVSWALEPFINFLKKGSFESSSSTVLQSMYTMPSSGTLIFGDGRYVDGKGYYMHTDVGFLRPIFFWGIFPTLLYYSIFFVIIIPIKYKLKRENGSVFCLLCLFQLLFFEIKGEILFLFFSVLFTIYLHLGLVSNKMKI